MHADNFASIQVSGIVASDVKDVVDDTTGGLRCANPPYGLGARCAQNRIYRSASIWFALFIPSHLHAISDFQKLSLTLEPNQLRIPLIPS
jgi:hypothetical protein